MAVLTRGRSILESLIGDSTLQEIFGGAYKNEKSSPKVAQQQSPSSSTSSIRIKELSSLANDVVAQCARILSLQPEELQQQFEEEAAVSAKQPTCYARHLLEYSSFRTLSMVMETTDHLSDKEFRRLTFDMMLAWEAPAATNQPVAKNIRVLETNNGGGVEDEEDGALFYSDLMPMMVDVDSTVGLDAFSRLMPAIPTVADAITVQGQFEALTTSTGGRLPFPLYDKYLGELDKSIKGIKGQTTPALVKALHLGTEETIIDIDGTGTTQPVLQHAGVSAWPGRLTLTDHAFYFEPLVVVSFDKAKKFDLSADLKHVLKPELTGPWGARIFDKAVMYKSSVTVEPFILEFPEMTGRARRDYWLAVIREVVAVHHFIHTYQLKGARKAQALAKAVLGIARLRATRQTFHVLPTRPETLLTFTWGEEMSGGDLVLAALAETLQHPGQDGKHVDKERFLDQHKGNSNLTNSRPANSGLSTPKGNEKGKEVSTYISGILIGKMTPLEKAIMQSRQNMKKVMLAEATIQGVKVEGIATNLAVTKGLLGPLVAATSWFEAIYSWEDHSKSITFCVLISYIIYRDWLPYIPPLLLVSLAGYMACVKYKLTDDPVQEILVPTPPGQSKVEQLLALQQALAQLEALLQACNISLLKMRALVLSAIPEATNHIIGMLLVCAAAMLLLPFQWLVLITVLNLLTLKMPVRVESTSRLSRRLCEWWYGIPVVPVRFLKSKELEKMQ